MTEDRSTLAILVVLVYAVAAGVVLGRHLERQRVAQHVMRHRVSELEMASGPALRAMQRERLDVSDSFDAMVRNLRTDEAHEGVGDCNG